MRNFFVSYSATFVLRAIALLLVSIDVWPIFDVWYCNGQFTVLRSLLFVFEFLVYNVIPIAHLALIHHQNFKYESD